MTNFKNQIIVLANNLNNNLQEIEQDIYISSPEFYNGNHEVAVIRINGITTTNDPDQMKAHINKQALVEEIMNTLNVEVYNADDSTMDFKGENYDSNISVSFSFNPYKDTVDIEATIMVRSKR